MDRRTVLIFLMTTYVLIRNVTGRVAPTSTVDGDIRAALPSRNVVAVPSRPIKILPIDPVAQFCNMQQVDPKIVFAAADRKLVSNTQEQKARSILGSSAGNEFVSTKSVIASAQRSEDIAETQVARSGLAAERLFDANGEQRLATVQRLARQASTCVYDAANAQACSSSSFREPTARCTSLTTKTWGMAGTPFTRILFPRYEDGISSHRTTEFSSGVPLRSPREISAAVTTTTVVLNHDGVSAHAMQWGQFISHEFTLIGEIQENVACCPDDICSGGGGNIYNGGAIMPVEPRPLTDAQIRFIMNAVRKERGDICIPVENRKDPVFGEYVCIHQTRSKIAPAHDCSAGPRQQMNMITHVFDGSAVYGSSQSEANALRTFSGGLMKTQIKNGATLPPCASAGSTCPFLGGDKRINTTPNLIAYHSMWLVIHNKIAAQLSSINPHWADERLYQETRRIVSALEANIHFYEYLPIILGHTIISKYNLGNYDGFDESTNPSILNELAGAAMRYGHSMIDGLFSLIKDDTTSEFVDLTPLFFDTLKIHSNGIKQCVRGLTEDLPWIVDRNYPTQMRNQLFNKKNDIVSLNINRGRDHGFASYLDYRRHYGLTVPTSWADLHITHPPDVVAALQSVYTTVEDIELYIGGVTENHVSGGLISETFANILGDGFSKNRKGDRLFFESSHSGLTAAQIAAIRFYTHSNFLCDGSDIDKVSSQGFFRIGFNGAIETPCSSLPKLDLSSWKEKVITPVDPCSSFGSESTKKMGIARANCGQRPIGDQSPRADRNASPPMRMEA